MIVYSVIAALAALGFAVVSAREAIRSEQAARRAERWAGEADAAARRWRDMT